MKRKNFSTMSFEDLVVEYTPTVQFVLRQYGFTGADLEDITQDVFLKVFSGNYQALYDPSKGSPSTFLQSLARRYALQNHSKRDRTPTYNAYQIVEKREEELVVGEVPVDIVGEVRDDLDLDFKFLCDDIVAELSKIPQRGKRNLVKLFEFIVQGYNQQDISMLMGLSRSTIYYMVKDLRDELFDLGFYEALVCKE